MSLKHSKFNCPECGTVLMTEPTMLYPNCPDCGRKMNDYESLQITSLDFKIVIAFFIASLLVAKFILPIFIGG